MRKRITAAVLSLVLLLMMFPVMQVNAAEVTEGMIAKEGDYAWSAGYGVEPDIELEAQWLYWDMTGESRQGECPYEEHTHTLSCRDKYWNRICGYDYEHEHDPFCIIDAVEYKWTVMLDLDKLPPSENPIITIYSYGPNGEPVEGCGYILIHERLKTDSSGALIVENGKYVVESILLGRTTTDENGVALLGLDELDLDPNEDTFKLVLGQELPNALRDVYRPITNRWYVTITRGAGGGCTIQSVTHAPAVTVAPDAPTVLPTDPEATEPEATEPATEAPEEPEEDFVSEYDKENNALTVYNDLLLGTIAVDVVIEGISGAIPAEFRATVTVTGPQEYTQELNFPVNDTGANIQQAKLTELIMGTYNLTATDAPELDGYSAEEVTVQVRCPVDEDAVLTEEVTLNRYHSNAVYTVTYRYTEQEPATEPPTEPETEPPTEEPPTEVPPTEVPPTEEPPTEEPPTQAPTEPDAVDPNQSNTVVVRAIDDQENPLTGTQIALYDGKTQLCLWNTTYDNIFVLDELEKFAVAGESVTYTLKQTRTPAGYRLSGDSYTIEITSRNGEVDVDVKKNVGSLESIFRGNGIEMGSDGKQIVTFRNARKTTQIQLTCNIAVDFAENSWIDEDLTAKLQAGEFTYILTWENLDGEQQEETLVLANGETALFAAEIPYDTDYEVRIANDDGTCLTQFSENYAAAVDATMLKENIAIDVTQRYTVEAGTAAQVSLVKVDAEDKVPMAGVVFELKAADGTLVQTYTSGAEGEMELRDVLTAPGSYTLEEIQTLEGYILLAEPVKIEVTTEYVLDSSRGMPVMMQNLAAEVSHSALVEESDGSFWVENAREAVPEETEERTGMGLGAIFGIVAAVAAAAGVAAFFLLRRRRGNG